MRELGEVGEVVEERAEKERQSYQKQEVRGEERNGLKGIKLSDQEWPISPFLCHLRQSVSMSVSHSVSD